MTRFPALVLAVYVVVHSTKAFSGTPGWVINSDGRGTFVCDDDFKWYCDDWAEALNAAHERLHPTPGGGMSLTIDGAYVTSSPKDCGPDNCGKEPK